MVPRARRVSREAVAALAIFIFEQAEVRQQSLRWTGPGCKTQSTGL